MPADEHLEKIESALRKHEAIEEVAIAIDKGKYAERIVAWVVCKPEAEVDIPAIRRHLKESLPAHTAQAMPSVFVFTKQLPMDASGEIDRPALSFDAVERGSNSDAEGPRNLLESIVTDVWKTIIGPEEFGVHDDFLDLGGDSIQAGLISLKIRDFFDVEIPLVMFFEDMTVGKLAEEIHRCQVD
jgi:acyl carrier protein